VEPPNKFIMRIFDSVIVECPNKENGCKDKIIYGSLSSHMNICIFKQKVNACEKCKKEVLQLLKKIDNLETQVQHLKNTIDFSKKCGVEKEDKNLIIEKIKFSLNMHIHLLYPISRGSFSCNAGCTFKGVAKSFYCSECDCDVCEKCFENCYQKSKDRVEKHIHFLNPLYSKSDNFRCDLCEKNFNQGQISFRCEMCNFDLCWKCYWP
jgi:hypothetical protein